MSRLRLGVAAAIILAVAAPAATVQAQKKKEAAAPAGTITEKDRQRGMAEAPALAKTAGLTCNVNDARFIIADPKSKTAFYEVACDQGIGYIVIADPAKPAPTLGTCMEANTPREDGKKNAVTCMLPGNADLNAQLQPYVAKVGSNCQVQKHRFLGANTKSTFTEIACQDNQGFLLVAGLPANLSGEVTLLNCLSLEPGGNVACTLTDRAAQLQTADKLIASSDKNCAVKDRKFVLTTQKGSHWYEVACQDGQGYMVEQAANGSLGQAIGCADADFIDGGCKLTDARAAKTEQNDLYSRLSTKAGFDCKVEQYGIFNVPNKEVVEVKCSNRPDGAVLVFEGAKNTVYNCAVAEVQGYRCSFTKKDVAYAQVTKDLKSLKETNCVVGNSRPMDRGTDTTVYLEGSCTDGAGSYVIGYQRGGTKPTEVLACSQAKSLGGCKFPGN
jgi:uncharacterized protein YgiM (DUF1202 family)